ncbi:hypothetical protein REG_1729 [Candidatus Regiella insecticola LSR1]|uniref:Uncharacterized protein n=1 Tax=Candidatus Regiella insecticola LSR1 TaxID=663321 RepID=E0WUF1_9ENTR|nr:hypothetical protein REG_1729 [Candidatus Regiella insecticola LSR1]
MMRSWIKKPILLIHPCIGELLLCYRAAIGRFALQFIEGVGMLILLIAQIIHRRGDLRLGCRVNIIDWRDSVVRLCIA